MLLRKLKGSTAREANKLLNRTGQPFWQDESYDRLVRDAEVFRRIEKYTAQNPVRAGLADSAEKYRWSSAWGGAGLKSRAGSPETPWPVKGLREPARIVRSLTVAALFAASEPRP